MAEPHLEDLERDGFSIMADVLSADLCQRLLDEVAAMEGKWKRSLVRPFHGFDTVRYFDLLNGPDIFQAVPAHPELVAIARAVLGRDCQLGSYGTVAIEPGETAQPTARITVVVPTSPTALAWA